MMLGILHAPNHIYSVLLESCAGDRPTFGYAPPSPRPTSPAFKSALKQKTQPLLAGVENYQGASTNVLTIASIVGCHPSWVTPMQFFQ
ncbi:hypothetical protein [Microcoleus sp. herbarium14]|uniref:hypothetical protein n=1 Tax=Microcoleus sp. herbarium14 TaxID=3055439 RepID=UPI002FD4FA91